MFFFTTSAFLAEHLRPLDLPASFFTVPFFTFLAFLRLALALEFPTFPGLTLELEIPDESPPFSFEFAAKQGVQELA